jgi:hypothetical protein
MLQNLLRTLTQSSVKPALQEGDFRLLLTAVKDSRVSVAFSATHAIISVSDVSPHSALRVKSSLTSSTTRSRTFSSTSAPSLPSVSGSDHAYFVYLTSSLVIQDNHDAEPFLNRVSKAEAPDYYDSTPRLST